MKISIADDYEQLSTMAALKQVLEREIVEPVTASLFRNHPGFRLDLDKAAAQLLAQ